MPPSGRKGKTRARRAPAATETHDPSDADTPEAIPTPTRGSRKRARGGDTMTAAPRTKRNKVKDTRPVEREDTEGTEPGDQSDNETEPSTPTEQEIIASLKVADKQVNATEDFANELLEGQESVPGYGKIAGRDWVFIIRKIEINIGRPEAQERLATDGDGTRSTPSAKSVIDIDLGPDRQISRLHAVISYDPDTMQWFLVVNGRNGVRVDNNMFRRGSKTYLRNGSVIEIANTQMAFITTPTEQSEGPVWDASILRQAQKSSEEDEDGEEDPRGNSGRSHARSGRSHLQDQTMYQSHHSSQQQNQQYQQQQRTHPHSQRGNLQATPGTPMRSQASWGKSSPAANYARGVMMESTESIDYSADNAKDLKPPHSYAQLIGMAILSTQEQQMTLNNIYKWIMANYAFYRFNTGGWQNSIRHNLSLNKAFTKIARRTDEPGKGMKWMIEPTEFDNFVQQGMKGCRRPNPIPGTQSTLGSPNSPMDRVRPGVKRDEDNTPPLNAYQPSYHTAMEAYTPDRGSRRPATGELNSSVGLGIEGNSLVDYEYPQRSTPRNGLSAIANAAGSPPALYVNDDGRTGALDTPFPLRPSQRLAPPSTLRRPSDFIQFSSPAPFWKMEGLVGSTPFKPFDLSPLKTPFPTLKKGADAEQKKDEEIGSSPVDDGGEKDQEAEPKGKGSPVISSSSPPRPHSATHGLDASPTLSRPATAVAKTLSQLANSGKEHQEQTDGSSKTPPTGNGAAPALPAQQQHTPPTTVSQSSQPAPRRELPQTAVANSFESSRQSANGSYNAGFAGSNGAQANGYHADDGEDEGIDLVKGFQPIGAFHQRNHLAMNIGMAGAGSGSFGR
ncbi:Fork-head transcriptional regulator 2 [Lecanosticta acicola]|uniref:Fork-head transcriptional regulator 2 n=1 Tax=Lecanosticta acicola TaxID=111012 RepID=A0AAI8Z7J0_9PEZI|nr:Fork-head transcriptional regulator 2 [Lecanosticta acicola]